MTAVNKCWMSMQRSCDNCMMLLAALCLQSISGENKVLAQRAGAVDAVAAIMKAHVGNAGVSEQAKKFLALLQK